jgi:hypothetical protein
MMPSVVLINGSFGVGKTTVARELRRRVAGSVIYDPEWAGLVIQRLSRVFLGRRRVDDFQDLYLWRRSVAPAARVFRTFARGPVFVPMTFSSADYLAFVLSGIRAFEPNVRVFCLVASLDTIRARLRGRSTPLEGPEALWIARQTEVCVRAHEHPGFGQRVDTECRSIPDVVDRILADLRQ